MVAEAVNVCVFVLVCGGGTEVLRFVALMYIRWAGWYSKRGRRCAGCTYARKVLLRLEGNSGNLIAFRRLL